MKKLLKQFATSKWFDWFGVALVVGIAISAGYLGTRLDKFVNWGSWTALVPFGLISVINVGISMLSTRFTGKLSKLGNYLGIINAVLSGLIDYILGNKAAIITYPVTFLIYLGAIYWWGTQQEGKASTLSKEHLPWILLALILGSLIFSYETNYIGYQGNMNTLAYITTVAFALSLVANGLNVLKLSTQWSFWLFYNFVQLVKAFVQGNFANVGKYIFYIFNSVGALFIWKDSEE
jgi:nicotinamide mononucleotide transporter pnuC